MREAKRGEEIKFWNYINECLMEIGRGSRIELIEDMNGRVGNNEVAGVVGKWVVDGMNENAKHLLDVCTERKQFLAKTFQHKMIHKFIHKEKEK